MSRRELLLESCEERILCDAAPDVSLQVPTNVKIGEAVQVTATFDNTSATDTGFGPYIDLVLKATGTDGAGAAVDDGVTFINATYLGAPVTATVLTFDAAGQAIHPYAKTATGAALVVNAPAGYGEGDQLVVLQLPFGSFSATQPPAAVTINLQTSNLADAGAPLGIAARGGFQYGNDALDNPTTDPSIIDPTYANATITPQLFTLSKVYLGPEDETATGPNFPQQYRIDIDVATGQTITNLQISDLLPGNLQFVSVNGLTGGTENVGARVTPSTTTPGGTLSRTITSITGVAGVDATLTFTAYVPRIDSSSAVIINATSGDDVSVLNNASVSGNWTPIDTRDAAGVVSINPAGPEHTLTAKSIATQKSVAIVTDTGAPGMSPGDTLEYTIQVQVSDYFAFQNLVLTDLFSDGQRFDASYTPTLTWTEHGVTYTVQNFGTANYTVSQNFTGAVASGPVFTIDPAANDGTTKVTFNLSNEMALRPGADGKLLGGGLPNAGTGAGALPNNPVLPFGPTTVTIKFRTVIQDKFSDNFPSGNASLNPGDALTNNVTVAGDLLSVTNVTTPTGQSEADTSGTTVRIVTPVISKAIYAINGSTTLPLSPTGAVLVKPGDTVTYRLIYTVPTGDTENLVLSDYLPLPIFNATQVTTFSTAAPSATAPPAGTAKWGPTETLRLVAGTPTPTVGSNAGNNLLTFTYPSQVDDTTNTPRVVDILFTVTVGAQPFADGLFLTNQVQASENNTQQPATAVTSNAIIQIQLQEPNVAIQKGIVGYNSTGLTLGGITFNAPGAATTFTGGPISNATQLAAIGGSDLLTGQVDAGDVVRYALVLQNSGRSDAYDASFKDQIINPGYTLPTGGTDAARLSSINFALRRGDGTLLVNGTDYTATLSAAGLLTVTMNDNYSAGNVGGETGQGALSRGFNASTATAITNGSNTLIATYDLTLTAGVLNAGAAITNTATLTNIAGLDGGPDYTTTDLTDTATVRTARPTLTKVLTGTEVTTGNNSNTQAVIGELVTYTLTLTVPEGSVNAASIADTLDAGLAFVDITSVTLSAGMATSNTIGTGTAPTNVTVTGSGQNLAFNFGTITNTNTNNAVADTITIVYRAVVLNANTTPNNQAGTLLNNSAVFSGQYTDRPTGTAQNYSLPAVSANNVTVIEPALNVTKGVGTALAGPFNATLTGVDAGDAVFYQIQITNPAGNPTAFELFLSDTLPATLTGLSIASVTSSGFATAPVAGDFQISGGVLSINNGGPLAGDLDVPGGATLTIIVQGSLTSAVQPNQSINNNATIRWTSMNGSVGTRSTYNASSTERTGGTLTPAANTNSSTNDTILNNYAATSATAAITINNPTPTKTIAATSEASTTTVAGVERVAVGEIVRYRLVWQIPEGTSTNLTVTDLLPTGMQFSNDGTARLAFVSTGGNISSSIAGIGTTPNIVGSETTLSGITPTFVIPAAQINAGPFVSGTDPVFSLGTITNPDNDANQEFIVVEFNAYVMNITANQRFNNVSGADSGAVNLSNQVTFATSTSTQTSAAVAVRVTEPSITNVTKTASAGPYDAGNVVTYTVTYANVNSVDAATAFDVVMTDTLPAFFTAVSFVSATSTGTVTGLSGSAAGNLITVNASSMAPGATVTVTYTGTLVSTVPAGQIVSNTARVAYTSLPGSGTALAGTSPGAAGTATGERTGTGGEGADGTVLNNYADSSVVNITVAAPVIDKSFKDGSITNDDTNVASSTGANVVVGEQITYDILVTLPEGVTQSLSVIDAVPAGLRVDGFQILTTAAAAPLLTANFNGSFTTTPASASLTGAGNLTINFGNTTVASDNVTTNNSFVIRVQATVLNILANQAAVTRTNTATLTYTNPNTATTATVADSNAANNPTVTVVEPAIVTTKTVSNATPDGSDPISYTITLSNTSGQTAYDVLLSDVLPAALVSTSITSVNKTGTIFINGLSATPVANTDVVISGGTLQFAGSSKIDIATGSTITIVVSGTVASAATPNLTVSNTAITSWTSTPGANADERTGADGVGGALNDYASSGTITFTVPQGSFAKQLLSTSEPSTSGSNVTIGETATYALIVTLPEGTTPGLSIIDVLPPGLQYVSSSVVTTVAASGGLLTANFNGTVPTPTITGGVSDGDDVTFTFGTITVTGDNNATNNKFLVLVTARVLDVIGNVGNGTQTVLPNVGTFDITGDGIPAFTTPNINVTVVEPKMTITKGFNVTNADAGDTVTVTLVVSNTGTSNAYDVIVNDPFPAGKFTSFTAGTTPAGFTFSTSGDTVTFSGGTINAGASATFTFTAVLTSAVTPNELLTNTATVTQATTLPGTVAGERNEPNVSGSAAVRVPVATLAKTLFATSEASTAGSNVTIGETVTYALKVTLPEGTTPDLTVVDVLPPGLQYTSFSIVTAAASSGGLLGANFVGTVPAPAISGGASSGAPVTFTFGSLAVTGDNVTTNNSFLILVTARVLDVAGNVGTGTQTVLPNSATLDISADGVAVFTTPVVNVTVVEPKMAITKDIDLTSADAGDAVTVTLVVNNTGTSNAYDVIVNDPFPAGKFTSFTAGTTPAGFTFSTSGDTVTFTGGTINAGASATFIFTAVLTGAVAPGEVLSNTATVTQATTLPGTVAGERNEPNVSGSDSVAVPIGSYSKSIFSTSDANTTGNNVGIGETVTYALKVTLPEGTTSNLSVVDLLPAGLQYISHSLFTTATGSGGLLAANFAGSITGPVRTGTTGDGDDQTFTFSSISVTGDNVANNNSFLLLVTARVLDVAGNVGLSGSQTTLNNQATFDIPTDGSPLVTTPNVPVVVVEPRLQITKAASDNTPDPGQVLTYTLNITHTASSTSIAYDVLLRDAIPTGITLNPASITVSGATLDSNASTSSLLDLKFTQLAVGGTITVTYTATVSTSPSITGSNLDNTAKIYWDTDPAEDTNVILSGGTDGAPDRDLGAGPGNEVYNLNTDPAQDTERVTVNSSTISGTVYRDLNADGSFNGADTGISGVTITLTGTDLNSNAISRTTTTDGTGAYSFSGLTPGVYVITETQPSGLTDALETVGTNFGGTKSDALDSNTISAVTIPVKSNGSGTGYNFGEVLPSSVAGSVYYDANNDGTRQGGETGIAAVSVRITGTDSFGQSVSTTATTDGSGNFTFNNGGTGLRPGTYTITELAQPTGYLDGKEKAGTFGGSIATNEQIGTFTLPTNTAATGYTFGELLPASLSGVAYVDANNDGVVDSGETLLGGVTITLTGTDDLGNAVSQIATTDAVTGAYSFTNLRPGTYVLTETQPSGYLDGKETAGTQTGTVSNAANSQTISAIPLTAGTNGTGNNFGELLASSLAGTVYRDLNNNGAIDGGETGISGVTVALSGTNDLGASVTASTTTDSNGNYSFLGLRPGTYTITETQPAGFLDGKDTIGTPGGTAGNDVFSGIVLASNTASANNNFGELPPSSLAGVVYVDANNDGLVGGGETLLSGATVQLTGTDDLGNSVTLTTTTNGSGAYSFTNLRPGNYVLTETQPSGYFDGKETAGTQGGTVVNGSDSQTISAITLAANTTGTGNNFGELRPASLAGTVYRDDNNDGLINGSEPGLAGAVLTLSGTDDRGNTVSATFTTTGTGAFSFANLRPGNYTITETTQPAGTLDGKDTIGTPGGSAGNDVFSAINLTEGTAGAGNNFGELIGTSLSGNVYIDANNDGTRQGGETGISGVTVNLTGTDDLGAAVSLSTTTSGTGTYSFTGLRPGTYVVTETQPSGYLDGKDAAGSAGGTLGNDTVTAITLPSNTTAVNYNFGELRPASLAGFVYNDANNDGTKQGGEAGIVGASVTLTGTDDLGNAVNTSTTTMAGGAYGFTNLRPGTYTITETQPANFLDGKDTIGTPGGTVGNDVFSGIVVAENTAGANNNFGELQAASISGNVYVDRNNDGVLDGGEPQINGVTITLTGTDDLGNAVNQTTTTVGGAYSFTGLRPGTYAVSETQPAGYLDGRETLGGPGGGTVGADTFTGITLISNRAAANYNFGELEASSVAGRVYDDRDNNGAFNGSDSGIGGVTVQLTGTNDLGAAVSLSTTTAADGTFSFANLRPGTYTVIETQPAAYLDGLETAGSLGGSTATNDQIGTFILPSNTSATGYLFGEVTPSSLAGFAYIDADNDGIFDTGETPQSGVTITLSGTDDRGNTVSTTAITDATGAYIFTNVRPGTYVLTETQPAGLLDGKETPGTPGGIVSDAANSQTISAITVVPATVGANNNFGDLLAATISGSVYVDANNDGTRDAGETAISGVAVTLSGIDDLGTAVSASTTTDGSGNYSFTGLRPGIYTVTETQPGAYLDGKDTAGTAGGSTATNDVISTITLVPNTTSSGNNFGELRPASLAGTVYRDLDNDGTIGSGETGVSGVTITLTGTDDLGQAVNTTTTTDGSGNYNFDGLRPGTYIITETQPVGLLDGKDTLGTPGGTTANDVFSNIVLLEGAAGVGNNFGELPPASLAGSVYVDVNNDGVKDAGEAAMAGVTITLTGTDDLNNPVSQTTTTDANGDYSFTNLRPGSYVLTEAQPAGYLDGRETAGTPGGTVDNTAESQTISAITLAANVSGVDNNFGELRPSGVSGTVYIDADNDGVLGSAEVRQPGVTITLTGTDDRGAVSLTTTTDSNGDYSFTNLRPGSYTLTETQPAGLLDGQDTLGTQGGTASNDSFAFTLTENVTGTANNFGELAPASLAGFVYTDANNDGVKDAGESGISGATVTLTGTDDLGAAVNLTATTTGTGAYSFTNLRPGTYTLTETQPAGALDGKDTIGTPGGTSGNDVFSGIIVVSGTAGVDNNFGELGGASIAGTVFSDLDNDGAQSTGEAGIGGVTITLAGTDDLGAAVSLTTTTDGSGNYSFTGLRPGEYTLTETQPVGYLDGIDTAGTASGVTGTPPADTITAITLTPGFASTGNTFGELRPSSLAGGVFIDVNNDGVRDAGEPPVVSVTITLTGTDDLGNPVSQTTTTDTNGDYIFTNLRPGNYTLTETQPAGLLDGRDNAGTPGGTTGNDTLTNIVLPAGTAGAGNNFGELRPSAISGTVFIDANNDGVLDATETLQPGVTLTLTGTDDLGNPVSLTTTTDSNGDYSFSNLRPGSYTLTETQPAGLLDGKDALGTQGGTAINDSFNFTLVENTMGTSNNFGEVPPGTIAGFVYLDENGDGVKNPNETGIGGVTIQLTGTDDLGNAVNRTTTTAANGAFAFNEVRPGTYTLRETQPEAYLDGQEKPGTQGGDTSTNDIIANIVLAPGGSAVDYLFGELPVPPIPPQQLPVAERPDKKPDAAPKPFIFAFDSFHNFSANGQFGSRLPGVGPIDIWKPAMLPLAPIYSGAANPGATLVVDLYNANGAHIASQTVLVDAGGNWLANFTSANLRDTPSDVRITQINAPYSFGAGLGNNLRTYYAPAALNPGHFLSQSTDNGLGDEPAPLLHGLDLANPLQLGPVKYGGEFLASEGIASGD